MSLRIDLNETVPFNIERIMQTFLDECRTSLQQEDPHQAIHEARKGMKKMRAFSRLVRGEIGKKRYKQTNTYYRDVARQISEARDITAMLDTLQDLYEALDAALCEQTFQDIKNHLVSRKSALSRIQINRDKLLENMLNDLEKAEKIHGKWKIEQNGFEIFFKGIKITYSKCQQAMKKAYKKQSTKNLHEWRKRCKYLRYEVDFLRDIWPEPMKSLERELHQLTDYLGDDHDLAVLKAYVESMHLENEEALTAIFALMDHKREELQTLAKPLGKRILYESPDQFVNRLAYYWKYGLKDFAIKENQHPLSIA